MFCEKPITENFKKAKELFKIAKKNKVNLYVSDVYAFHKKKINKIFSYNKIKREKNRLGGKIVIHEMQAYTGIEIDEEDDWIIAERFMKKHVLFKNRNLK